MIKSVVDLFFGGDGESNNQSIPQQGQTHQERLEYLQPQGYIVPVIAWHGHQQQQSQNVRSFESQILSSNLDLQHGEITMTSGQLHSTNRLQKAEELQIPSKVIINGNSINNNNNKIIQSSGVLATDIKNSNQILNEFEVDRRTRSLPDKAFPINQLQNLHFSTESPRQSRQSLLNGFNASVLQIVTSDNNQQLYVQCSDHTEYYITNICCSSNCLMPLCPECLCKHIHADKSIPQIENILVVKQAMIINQQKILNQLTEQKQILHQTIKTSIDRTIKANRDSLEGVYQELIRNIDVYFVKARESLEIQYSEAQESFKEMDDLYENELENRSILIEQLNQPLYLEQLINAIADQKMSEQILEQLCSSKNIQRIQEFTSQEYVPQSKQDTSQAIRSLIDQLLVQREKQGNLRQTVSDQIRQLVQTQDTNSISKVSQVRQSKTLPDVDAQPMFHHKSQSSIAIPAKSLKNIQLIQQKNNNGLNGNVVGNQKYQQQSNLSQNNTYGLLNQNHRSFTGKTANKINPYELIGSQTPIRTTTQNNQIFKSVQQLNFSADSEEIADEFEQQQFNVAQQQERIKQQSEEIKPQNQGNQYKKLSEQQQQQQQQKQQGQDKQFLDVLVKTTQQNNNNNKLSSIVKNTKQEKGGDIVPQNQKEQIIISSQQQIKIQQNQRQQQQQQRFNEENDKRIIISKQLKSQEQIINKQENDNLRQVSKEYLKLLNLKNISNDQPTQLVSFIEGNKTVQVIQLDQYLTRNKQDSQATGKVDQTPDSQSFIQTYSLDIPFCIPLNHAAIAIPNSSTILLTGGVLYQKDKVSATNSVYKLSEDKQTLIALPSMIHQRSSHTLVYASNKVFAIGGSSTFDEELPLKSCEYFDLTKNQWFSMKDCIFGASGSGCCVFDKNWIYKFGGKSSRIREVLYAERYNIQKDYWEEIDIGTTLPLNYYPICLQVNENQILLCGGLRHCVRSEAAFVLTIQKDNTIVTQEIHPQVWQIDYQYAQVFINRDNQLLILKDATKVVEDPQGCTLFVRFEKNQWDII